MKRGAAAHDMYISPANTVVIVKTIGLQHQLPGIGGIGSFLGCTVTHPREASTRFKYSNGPGDHPPKIMTTLRERRLLIILLKLTAEIIGNQRDIPSRRNNEHISACA